MSRKPRSSRQLLGSRSYNKISINLTSNLKYKLADRLLRQFEGRTRDLLVEQVFEQLTLAVRSQFLEDL